MVGKEKKAGGKEERESARLGEYDEEVLSNYIIGRKDDMAVGEGREESWRIGV